MSQYCLVADLLGFKRLLENLAFSVDLQDQRVREWAHTVKRCARAQGIDQYALFSDTLFVVTEGSSDGLRQILSFSQDLLNKTINRSLPIRGALSFGDVHWQEPIIFGNPITQAYLVGESLQWVGIAAEPKALPHIGDLWSWDLVCSYPVPRDRGPVEHMPAVVWNAPADLRHRMAEEGLMEHNEHLSWPIARKCDATRLFIQYCAKASQDDRDPSSYLDGEMFTPIDFVDHTFSTDPSR